MTQTYDEYAAAQRAAGLEPSTFDVWSERELARLDEEEERELITATITLTMTGAEARNMLEHSEDFEAEGMPQGEDLAEQVGEYMQNELISTLQFNTNSYPAYDTHTNYQPTPEGEEAAGLVATHTRQRVCVAHALDLLEVTRQAVAAWDGWRNDPMLYDDSPEPDYITQGRAIITKLEA